MVTEVAQADRPLVVVLSDAIGETGEIVARAALSQFVGHDVDVRRFSHVDRMADLDEVFAELDGRSRVFMIYTVVLPEVREELRRRLERLGVPGVDLMGPVMEGLERLIGVEARHEAGLIHRLDAEYFRRIAAMEFAVRYDDGKDPRGILAADVVLLGVSRTSKTPVSMYLAHRHVKVANIPLVPEADLPDELFQVSPQKLIGLTIDPEILYRIRSERLKSIGLSTSRYADMDRIVEELEFADRVFRRLGCRVVDVSNRAIEETANVILEFVTPRRSAAPRGGIA
jgi:regulator of PEP synthase PpsR (kinase-PPPase family)